MLPLYTYINILYIILSRFTFVPACLANGEKLKAMVILKGLVKVPKIKIPNNIVVTVAKKGTMTAQIMEQWRTDVWEKRGNPLQRYCRFYWKSIEE